LLLSKLAKRSCYLLFLAIIAFYFYGLGYLPFVGPDEPRYAQVAREMFLRGDLITPTLGGYTWFEKPVLLYWLMQLGFLLFGVSEWVARLGPAVCGLLTIVSVYWLGNRVATLSPDADLKYLGCSSALILASMPGVIIFSRGASFDIIVTMTLSWSLACFLLAELETDQKRRRSLTFGFYLFMGLSLLAKGLIGLVIPFGVIALYYTLRRSLPKRWFLSSLAWGLALTTVVASIWYVPVLARHGWPFIDQFIIQHHFARYLSNKYSHPQPFFFYFVIIFPLALPWLVMTIDGLRRARHWDWTGRTTLDRFRVFCVAWLLLPLLFFSFSGSKLPGYILPVLPPIALLAGERTSRFLAREQSFSSIRIMGTTLVLFAIGAVAYVNTASILSPGCALLIVTPLLLAGVLSLVFAQFKRVATLAIVFAIPLTIILALNCDVPKLAVAYSARHLIEEADARGYGAAPVYSLHEVNRGVEFYAAGRVIYGRDGQPRKFEGAEEILKQAGPLNAPVLVIVPTRWLNQLTDLKSVEVEVIADNGELTIVTLRKL
jgi:4-amino-4-deoxy-L-arabinose transferase-like glycosyltransferase